MLGKIWFIIAVLAPFSIFGQFSIIPKPASLEARPGRFVLTGETVVRLPAGQSEVQAIAQEFIRQVKTASGLTLSVQPVTGSTPGPNSIAFVPVSDARLGAEGYRLEVAPGEVTIEAAQPSGFFYAIQSLYQLLPPAVFSPTPVSSPVDWSLPACRIEDAPRFRYRGLHLDVARHFFPVSFIKKYIDLLAMHKFNTFHWHLTDDQGWRIEIKKYPKLTQVGGWRKETLIGHYYESDPQEFDGRPYGGFYTQDEVREVVRYARSKYVTVIPEIEMPGHARAALAAYPELGCSGGTYETATKWGIFKEVFCPYDKTFDFLQDVLTEVMSLFPGPYLHIGGDECPKISWKQSPFCQNLIRKLKLKNENQLQSYFTARIDRWVTSKGWKIIGWDEILEGNSPAIRVSPSATVMVWRRVEDGIRAAQQGHDVIMTPENFVYLDHYQGDRAQEPLAFGRFTPLEETYSFEPTPADLPASVQNRILGVQASVWTEYLKTPEQVEYMVWPRAAAVAEIAWTDRDQKSWPEFRQRLPVFLHRLDYLNTTYSRTYYAVRAQTAAQPDGRLQLILTTSDPNAEIRYTTDGMEPTPTSGRYEQPVLLAESANVKAVTVRNGEVIGPVQTWELVVSRATGKPIRLSMAASKPYDAEPSLLTDGQLGTTVGYLQEMQGVQGVKTADLTTIIDLQKPQTIQTVSIGLVRATAGDILLPKAVEVAVSDDGQRFQRVKTVSMNPAERGKQAIIRQTLAFEPVKARFVRIIARNAGKVPIGMPRAGKPAWVLADEMTID
ncbi:family 20 glycosylhydrolase [Larkinella sp. VNQ87]|uniref:beta-N-acetylhexosaminidase n=1 Tax=Larkinella sp. VNQ87 TaxID=3400921 RepID=UPI003BFEA222